MQIIFVTVRGPLPGEVTNSDMLQNAKRKSLSITCVLHNAIQYKYFNKLDSLSCIIA